jgi:Mn-containing catalase
MYHHIKKLMYTVNVGSPDPRFGNMLLEQFGGANGELAAAMQYSIQGLNCDDPDRKDMLMDSSPLIESACKIRIFKPSRKRQQGGALFSQSTKIESDHQIGLAGNGTGDLRGEREQRKRARRRRASEAK